MYYVRAYVTAPRIYVKLSGRTFASQIREHYRVHEPWQTTREVGIFCSKWIICGCQAFAHE